MTQYYSQVVNNSSNNRSENEDNAHQHSSPFAHYLNNNNRSHQYSPAIRDLLEKRKKQTGFFEKLGIPNVTTENAVIGASIIISIIFMFLTYRLPDPKAVAAANNRNKVPTIVTRKQRPIANTVKSLNLTIPPHTNNNRNNVHINRQNFNNNVNKVPISLNTPFSGPRNRNPGPVRFNRNTPAMQSVQQQQNKPFDPLYKKTHSVGKTPEKINQERIEKQYNIQNLDDDELVNNMNRTNIYFGGKVLPKLY